MSNTEKFPVVLFANAGEMGGLEEHVIQLGRELTARGHQVAAICRPLPGLEPLRRSLAEAGVTVHCSSDTRRNPVAIIWRFWELYRTIKSYPRCVVHLHMGINLGDAPVLAAYLAKAQGIIRTEHMPPEPKGTTYDKLRVRLRDKLLTSNICVSQQTLDQQQAWLKRDARKVKVVYNGIDLIRFTPVCSGADVRAEFGIDPLAPIVGSVTRLSEPRKGVSYFIQMAAHIARARPEVRFLLVGDGPLRAQYEQQASDLGIASNIIFTGRRTDVPRMLGAMDVFVMPSLTEACQYNLLEAMAMARPIVSTPAGVAPEAIKHGINGLLVPLANDVALAEATTSLLDDRFRASEMGQRARESAEKDFSISSMVDKTLRVYQDVVYPSKRLRVPSTLTRC